MGMLASEVGGGVGFVYITKADGTTVVSNIENTSNVWQQVQKYPSANLDNATQLVNNIYGFRIFGNTTGTDNGSLVGATELTRFFVNRASQAARYRKSATIASGVVTIDRVSNDTLLVVDTEGALATDALNTLTLTDAVDNDVVTIVGENIARIVTVVHGAGNIFLSNSANFSTANRQTQITLRYFASIPVGWYEVSRINSLPTVINHRAVSVPEPVSGIATTNLTFAGGTITLTPGIDKGYQVLAGTAVLAGSYVVQINPAPVVPYLDGDEMTVDYRGILTQGGNTVTIFGITLTATQALQGRLILYARYNISSNTWYYRNMYDASGVDITNKAYVDSTFEPYLQLPAADDYILSSTALGVRSWIPNVTPDTGWIDLLGFSFMPGGTRPQYRVIGKQLDFRGILAVPLSNDGGTTLIPYTNEASYLPQFYSAPYSGSGATGGVQVNATGNIVFNQNAAVIDASHFPDMTYSTPFFIAARRINSDVPNEEISYTAAVVLSISTAGKLILSTLYDLENLNGTNVGHSPLRFITSNVTSGDYALDFRVVNTADTLFGITANTALPLTIKQQTFKHQLTFDAAKAENIGGFLVNIGNLKGFLA